MDALIFAAKAGAAALLALFSSLLWGSTPDSWFFDDMCERVPARSGRDVLRPESPGYWCLFWTFLALLLETDPAEAVMLCPVWVLLIQLSLSDGLYMVLQDQWSLALAGLGLVRALCARDLSGLFSSAMGAGAVLLLWLLSTIIAASLKKGSPLGLGDAKLLAADAVLLGTEGMMRSAAAASAAAGVWCALLLLFKKAERRDRISFGPFICLGIVLYL
ncbi:MAG: prepilin peptidase [Firmicutes bacterium]|nr:prepilin peptidase [Bacillota bacterium]